ncbi:MAG: multiheme c-type cytochrome [Sandaracinus sp.]
MTRDPGLRPRSRMERRLLPPAALLALLVLTGSGGSCSDGHHGTTPESAAVPEVQAADLGRAELRVVVLTDLKGYLEPCGCTSHPLGGLDRLAARLTAIRSDGAPTLVVAAGNLFFDEDRHGMDPELSATQERWRAETVADGLTQIGLAAAAPGQGDLREGLESLAALVQRAHFPLVGSGAHVRAGAAAAEADAGTPAATDLMRDHVVLDVSGVHVGIIGIAGFEPAAGVEVPADPVAALEAAATAARAEGATVIVALVDATRRDARRWAAAVPGVDVLVAGGLEEDAAHPPSVNGAIVVTARQQGQGIAVVELHGLARTGDWVDASTWSRTEERDRHVREATDLRARIAEWERDGTTSAEDLAAQRQHLSDVEAVIAQAARAPEITGRAFTAAFVPLPDDSDRDPTVRALLEGYAQRVNEHNRVALAGVLPPPVAEGQASYVGTARCGECHAEAVTWWGTTLHGHAYQTLVDVHKEYNLSCVGCHVTGYQRPGGSTVTHLGEQGELRNVGCENCHGPGSLHSDDPDGGHIARDMAEDTCLRCHTPEHSDRFVYDVYRRMMIAPGHGQPSTEPTPQTAGGT